MVKKTLCFLISIGFILHPSICRAQLNINNAPVYIKEGTTVAVLGNLMGNTNVTGQGKLLLNGTANQLVDFNGFSIPGLEINNSNNITLASHLQIGSQFIFTDGKLVTGDYNLRLSDTAVVSGQGTGRFFETNGTGQLQKRISSNLFDYPLPVGSENIYTPVKITAAGNFSDAIVGVQAIHAVHPEKHIRSTDYLGNYWSFTRSGINGALSAKAQYEETAGVTGAESLLNGVFWNGAAWDLSGSFINTSSNEAGTSITGNGDLYAMNKFVLTGLKVFLQGPFNSLTGLMDDKLRNPGTYAAGTFPAGNLLPLSDPYRTAPLNSSFTHINNPETETIADSVLNDQSDPAKNIVDWVFLELRNNDSGNPGANIVQTRSALLRRNGEIVDIDGSSPVYFKGMEAGSNYTIAVRHRNHLGISTDPVSNMQSLGLAAPISPIDFTSMNDAAIFGPSTAFAITAGKNTLWAGNVNSNNTIRYNGPSNDRDYLLSNILNSNQGAILNDVYNTGDINMNRVVRYNGPSNDRDYLLSVPLDANQGNIRTAALPVN